jgi:hypothetical protein
MKKPLGRIRRLIVSKEKIIMFLVGFVLLIAIFVSLNFANPDPVTITTEGVLPEMSLDQKIYASEIIVIGEIKTILPSKWNTLEEVNTSSLSSSEVHDLHFGMFTDVIVKPQEFLKGNLPEDSVLRVRSFSGKIEHISFVNSMEPDYAEGQLYLFLLRPYWGPVDDYIDPGFYLTVNSGNGVFFIENGKATSKDAEWALDDLVTYIDKSRWALTEPNIPEGDEAKEIIKTVERAYDVESEVVYDFDLSKLSTVFVNDPRFPLDSSTLQTVSELTNNPSLESAGFLDYKMAYYSWRRDATLHAETVYAKAKSENRDLTDEEKKSLVDPYGRIAPPRAKDTKREYNLTFLSVEINDDIALVVLDTVGTTVELTLVYVNDNWYITGIRGIVFHP